MNKIESARDRMKLSKRKRAIQANADLLAGSRDDWIARNSFYYRDDRAYMRFLVRPGQRVLELGCGTGDLLSELEPARGVGVDLSSNMVDVARRRFPHLQFLQGDIEDAELLASLDGPFDVIILSDTIGYLDDCAQTLESLHSLCTPETRIVITYYAWFWEPILKLGEKLGLKMPSVELNWLSTEDTMGFLHLADFEPVKREWRQIVPKQILGLGTLINRFVGTLPLIRRLSLRNYLVARPLRNAALKDPSVTVLIPCRNEQGNIENAVKRLPRFCSDLEVMYVEGHSSDGTLEEIHRVIALYPDLDIKVLVQDGKGKGDAVRKGFANARGDILMILDADLTVAPEDLTKFYDAIAKGKGEFINGSRLVYPMQDQAMRFLNFLANRTFSWLFTWLLNQRYTDTLCGTKVLSRKNYEVLYANRSYFGDFDPFGDFDLIFGATKLNLKVIEIPIRYAAREYGETQISRFRHGWLLLKMVVFAYRKLKIN
ncbi:MAG: glycosyl transferase [Rhodocyclales bacterium RIFCSPLOWO2_02_FULL_63_24]|nr:MAG: glycosyl transferase [Rhodocyclales bacterium RIFCSPLOWO2_02_FULL_63_24]